MVKRKPYPTQKKLLELFDYDSITGVLRWKIDKSQNTKAGSVAGTINAKRGHRQVSINYKHYYAHIIIWIMQTGKIPNNTVDHINRIRSDNRWINLREATTSQQAQNGNIRSTNKSGIVGVYWVTKNEKWKAHITINNERIYLGLYDKKHEAVKARRIAEQNYFGEYAPKWDAVKTN